MPTSKGHIAVDATGPPTLLEGIVDDTTIEVYLFVGPVYNILVRSFVGVFDHVPDDRFLSP